MGNNSFYRFAANSSKPGALVLWAGSSENGHTIDTEIFVGSQFHPELKSRPNHAHPLFRDFLKAALTYSESK